MTAAGIVTILGYVTKLALAGTEITQVLDVASAALARMKTEGRDPTEAELDRVRDDIVARGDRIQNA